MVSQPCECTKNHWIVHWKWVNFMVCKLYLNNAVKTQQKEKKTIEHPIDILYVLMNKGGLLNDHFTLQWNFVK